jgi:hypothetical protein
MPRIVCDGCGEEIDTRDNAYCEHCMDSKASDQCSDCDRVSPDDCGDCNNCENIAPEDCECSDERNYITYLQDKLDGKAATYLTFQEFVDGKEEEEPSDRSGEPDDLADSSPGNR